MTNEARCPHHGSRIGVERPADNTATGILRVRAPLTLGELTHIEENLEVFRFCREWITQYLAQPHRGLGRTGNVCPFARAAITKDSLSIAVVRLSDPNYKKAHILEAITAYRDEFSSLGTSLENEMLQALLILFPDVQPSEAADLIDGTKEELKASFVERGLMLGEFHADNESPGLHNPLFKPLRSEIPMLAIRRMVMSDHVFLNRSDYDPATRLQYVETYLKACPTADSTLRQQLEAIISMLQSQVVQSQSLL